MDPASPASSDNDAQDEIMDDIDGDPEADDNESSDDKDSDADDDDNGEDMDGDGDIDGDGDGDAEQDVDGDGDGDDNEDGTGQESDSRAPPRHDKSASPPPARPIPNLRPEAKIASTYDIVPYVAAPHSTSINAFCATPCMRWVFTGGSDGYIRKFDWFQSINGKVPLTVAQKHPFVDSVTRAGVLLSYWENEEPAAAVKSQYLNIEGMTDDLKLSPVYSLAVHNQALWLLSGLESGGINLQSCRHDEGKIITCLRKHTSAVSVLTLAYDERSVLSGAWDKAIYDWDLNTGDVVREFTGSAGQISSIAWRPNGPDTIAVPKETMLVNGVSGGDRGFMINGSGSMNGLSGVESGNNGMDGTAQAASPVDSVRSFGSLFGDDGDDEFSAAVAANGMNNENNGGDEDEVKNEEDTNGNDDNENPGINGARGVTMGDTDLFGDGFGNEAAATVNDNNMNYETTSSSVIEQPNMSHQTNGIDQHRPHNLYPSINTAQNSTSFSSASSSTIRDQPHTQVNASSPPPSSPASITPSNSSPGSNRLNPHIFLCSAMDGTIRLWDVRQRSLVALSTPSKGVPPWAMNACWSTDGNFIYVGRRNGTVEEYSIHRGINQVNRTLKLPPGSGSVSSLWAMPNGRHLMCASYDNLRLYDLNSQITNAPATSSSKQQQHHHSSAVPFLIVPGHHGGVVSQLYVDPTCTFVISTGGNRGWEGAHTEVLLGYEAGCIP